MPLECLLSRSVETRNQACLSINHEYRSLQHLQKTSLDHLQALQNDFNETIQQVKLRLALEDKKAKTQAMHHLQKLEHALFSLHSQETLSPSAKRAHLHTLLAHLDPDTSFPLYAQVRTRTASQTQLL